MKTLELIKLNESGANNVVVSLQQLLADFQVYYTNLRGFHWNIKGHDFFVLHSQFEKMYDDTAEKVDEIAERTCYYKPSTSKLIFPVLADNRSSSKR